MEEMYAKALSYDKADTLSNYRKLFHIPCTTEGKEHIYFCGNSLGLQPRSARDYIEQELIKWQNQAVEGHFTAPNPWLHYHKLFKPALAHLTGAGEHEVTAMNNLTTNLHLMMVSFYQPTRKRFKILMEGSAFPSDQYAVESQVKYHGFDPAEAIIALKPTAGEEIISPEDVLEAIEQHGSTLALVLLPGIQYYTGQWFDLPAITKAAHAAGAKAGYDLAHAIGNMPMQLHDWDVDFAVWCSYKYLNAGPGNTGGAFVHDRYAQSINLPRFAGWWGHEEGARFRMEKEFNPIYGVDGWQLSNVNILSLAAQRASLDIILGAGITQLREKSIRLTGFLESCIRQTDPEQKHICIITPQKPEQRGCQLSLFVQEKGKEVYEKLSANNIIIDWREPNVIRVAPTPLYNTFEEVYRFAYILQTVLAI